MSINSLINSIKNKLFSLDYLPRWMVFLMDVGLTIISTIISFLIVRSLRVNLPDTIDILSKFGIVILVHIISFIIFKTYFGILRHSTFMDGVRLFFSTFCSFFLLILINYSCFFITGKKIYLFPLLVIIFISNFLVLFLFRVCIKVIFENINLFGNNPNLIKAVVYGIDSNAVSIVSVLKFQKNTRFKIVGFIDKKNHRISNTILDIPILNSRKKIAIVLRSINAEALIIADTSLSKKERLNIVDECLQSNIKVFTAPIVTNWENEKEISNKIMNIEIEDLLDRNSIVLDKTSVSDQLNNKTILITGAAGSIGSEIVRQIISFKPKKIIILDQAETPLHFLKLELDDLISKTELHTIICDVRNKASLKEVFINFKPEVVFHAAAYKHVPMMEFNPREAVFANVLGTKNTADLSLEYGVNNFVFISTDKAVNPSNVMGASKRIAEIYIQSLFLNLNGNKYSKTKFITTRFGNVLGSSGSVVPLFSEQIKNGGPITITHPDVIRYFMTIPEACQLVLEAGAMGNGGEIFIFDMGEPVKIIDLAKKMILLAGLVPEKDIEIKIVGLRPGEKLFEELLNGNSKTMPTHHEKISISIDMCSDYSMLLKNIDELILLANSSDNTSLVLKMKSIVPEFISMNSKYEELVCNENDNSNKKNKSTTIKNEI